jgi:UDPglucose--hexose-1-phosphate uridylyltransferase
MSELRQDPTTGAWVLIASERGSRPRRTGGLHEGNGAAREYDPSCPFCPGQEALLPAIIAELPARDGEGWQIRVVPNKYPAVRPCAPEDTVSTPTRAQPGCGRHEVIIETSLHSAEISSAEAEPCAVLEAYRLRYVALINEPDIKCVLPFRNYGGQAGASIVHPHSQIIAFDRMLPRLAAIREWCHAKHIERGVCVMCEVLGHELEEKTRIVALTARHVVLTPYAAASPYETWIVPREHQNSFVQAGAASLADLAAALKDALTRMRRLLQDPPYNYVIESFDGSGSEGWLHWRLRIVPSIVRPGGFEIGSGLPINPSSPEEDAAALRNLKV